MLNENTIGRLKGLQNSGFASGPPVPGILGYDEIGTNSSIFSGSEYIGTRFTAAESRTYNFVNVYTRTAYVPNSNISVAAFSATLTTFDTLIASGSGVYDSTFAWIKIPCVFSVTAGSDIYLTVWGEEHFEVMSIPGTLNQTTRKYLYSYNAWESPNTPANQDFESNMFSIYASEI